MTANQVKYKKWSDFTRDPNSIEAITFRINNLTAARKNSFIKNRIDYLCALASGKSVLDVGVVAHFQESAAEEIWLHQHICKAADSCLGIDILEDDVKILAESGYQVRVHDICHSPLPLKFDLIIAGELVEHLDSPAALFQHSARMLHPNGKLVITTPNPWYINAILKNSLTKRPFTDSVDHVAWFDAGTLAELANRAGLTLSGYAGVKASPTASLISRIFFKLSPWLIRLGFNREIFCITMIYEFTMEVDDPA